MTDVKDAEACFDSLLAEDRARLGKDVQKKLCSVYNLAVEVSGEIAVKVDGGNSEFKVAKELSEYLIACIGGLQSLLQGVPSTRKTAE